MSDILFTENNYGVSPPDVWEEIKLVDYNTGIYVYLGKGHIIDYLNALANDEEFQNDGIKVCKVGESIKLTLERNIESDYVVTEYYQEASFILTKKDLESILSLFE